MTAGNGVMDVRRSVRNMADTSFLIKVPSMKPRDTSASVGLGCFIPVMRLCSSSGRYLPWACHQTEEGTGDATSGTILGVDEPRDGWDRR